MLIDIHVHLRDPALSADQCLFPTPEELLQGLDRDGIDRAVVMGIAGSDLAACALTPKALVAICGASEGRLIPFAGIDPREHRAEDIRDYLADLKTVGCKGIGELVHNIPFDDPLNDAIFAAAEELQLPMTAHIAPELGNGYGLFDGLGLPRLESVLQRFPGMIMPWSFAGILGPILMPM